jgi:hypothetical protein
MSSLEDVAAFLPQPLQHDTICKQETWHTRLGGIMEPGSLSSGEKEWLDVRRFLEKNRFELGKKAAEEYPSHLKFFDTPLLTRRTWFPDYPISLSGIELDFVGEYPPDRSSQSYGAALPVVSTGSPYENYTDAYQKLAAPRVFENRGTYRLTEANLVTSPGLLRFGYGRYFDSLNTGEASAHAFAAECLDRNPGSIRLNIDDPCDAAKRPINLALSALTIRRDPEKGRADFFLHWRDPKKVGHAGGLFQVVPSGVFQASGEQAWNHANDFSLLRFLAREFAEELGGKAEQYDNSAHGIDYERWPFAKMLLESVTSGSTKAWCLGIGVDPLTFATDLLAVFVFDAPVFSDLFGEVVAGNDEGRILAAKPFTGPEIRNLVERERMQAAGAALLAGAWHHRDILLE